MKTKLTTAEKAKILAEKQNPKDKVVIISQKSIMNPLVYTEETVNRVIVQEGVKKIPYAAFANIESLTNVELNEGLEEIGDKAFYGDVSLKSIIIPESVKKMGNKVFLRCPSLEIIACSKQMFDTRDTWLAGNPGTISIVVYDTKSNFAREVKLNKALRHSGEKARAKHQSVLEDVEMALFEKGITEFVKKESLRQGNDCVAEENVLTR